jgi:putative ABC transport system permease protein
MVYTRLGIREIRQRPGRAILTLLSIVIGVAAVIAVSLASDTTGRAFEAIYETVAGKAAFEITAPFGTTFDASVADEVGKVPGVADVSPVIERTSVMYVGDKRIQFMLMGVEPERDLKVHAYRIIDGKKLGDGPGVIMDASFAKTTGIKLGDRVEIVTPRGTVRALVSGLFQPRRIAVDVAQVGANPL